MTFIKKILILNWIIVGLLFSGITYWYSPKTDQGKITEKIRDDGSSNTMQIVIDNYRHYQFANIIDWNIAKKNSIISITFRQISLYPIVIPLIEGYEIIKKPPQ